MILLATMSYDLSVDAVYAYMATSEIWCFNGLKIILQYNWFPL